MQRITSVERLETIVGRPSSMVLQKAVTRLDEGCRRVLAESCLASFGFRNPEGLPCTTFIGGLKGFARAESASRLIFEHAPGQHLPVKDGGVSLLFLLPGVGETLRVNGSVVSLARSVITVQVQEAFVHCARCVLRSNLWQRPKSNVVLPDRGSVAPGGFSARELSGPLSDPRVLKFIEDSAFLAVSSWNAEGCGDTSPRGDPPGFLQLLDGHTLAIPDRKGNRRADTFHNLLTCDEISLACLVHGSDNVLHLSGKAWITDDPALLNTMALTGKAPQAALIVSVACACIVANTALGLSRLWDASVHSPQTTLPDLNLVATQHLSSAKTVGPLAWSTAALARVLGRLPPGLMRRLMKSAYRQALRDEGY